LKLVGAEGAAPVRPRESEYPGAKTPHYFLNSNNVYEKS